MHDYSDNTCRQEDIAAYLDGELNAGALESFEEHVKSCRACAAELLAQRQLLCTLDVAFGDSRSFDVPKNFTRLVTARAESDLSGMRNKRERRRALQLCGALGVIAFGLLGAATQTIVLDPIRSVLKIGGSLLQLLSAVAAEVATSAAVVVRVASHALTFRPRGLASALIIAFLLAISFLLYLIARYHRAQIIE